MLNILQQIEAKDWVLFLLGSGTTILLSMLRYLVAYFREYSKITPLLGEWHSYHFSRANHVPIFRHTRWFFKRSFMGLRMKSIDSKKKTEPYRGRVYFEAGHVVINAECVNHREETWQARFNDPIPNEQTMMIGIELAQYFDREMFATVELCSRIEMTEADAKAVISKYTRQVEQEYCIRVRKDF